MQTFIQTEGIIKATAKNMPNHPTPTSYSQINRRVNNLDTVSSRSSSELDGDDLTITVDSNGITVTNRGQWMYDKLDTQNKKKVYPNIYVTVNIKTKEILALENTDGRVHDGKVMYYLLKHILKSNNKGATAKIKSVLADVRMTPMRTSNTMRKTKFIQPGINVRKNSII
jgi:hypothetical protein